MAEHPSQASARGEGGATPDPYGATPDPYGATPDGFGEALEEYGETLGELAEEPPWLPPRHKVPHGDVYQAARAGDVDRLQVLLEEGVDVNLRDAWDSVPLYYACLAGHLDVVVVLLEAGAICCENTFDGDRCHYASLTLRIRRTLKAYEMRPPPLAPLPRILRECFDCDERWCDTTFVIGGSEIRCHRAVLATRSAYFRKAFAGKWMRKKEIRFANPLLTYPALHSLLSFFYSDRLEIDVEDMEDLARICHVCKCDALKEVIEREIVHQKYAKHKSIRSLSVENGEESERKRYILQGSSLPFQDGLQSAMEMLFDELTRHIPDEALQSKHEDEAEEEEHFRSDSRVNDASDVNGDAAPGIIRHTNHNHIDDEEEEEEEDEDGANGCMDSETRNPHPTASLPPKSATINDFSLDSTENAIHADVFFQVGDCMFPAHRFILASRSDYFKALFSRMSDFQGTRDQGGLSATDSGNVLSTTEFYMTDSSIPVFPVEDLSPYAFKKLLEFIYTDKIREIIPEESEHVLEAASRYLLFPLKRAVADCLLPLLESASPPEICRWLLISEMYDVWKLREFCLDCMASNFEVFASTVEFCLMLGMLPPPSGDSSLRTTAPSKPGMESTTASAHANVLDDLREKWLELEGAELEARDLSALEFDKRLMELAHSQPKLETNEVA